MVNQPVKLLGIILKTNTKNRHGKIFKKNLKKTLDNFFGEWYRIKKF
jgi:hypothetical protein